MSLACKTHWATKDFQSQSASEIWSGQFLSPVQRYDSLGFYYARDALKSDNNNGSNETANL